MDTEIAIKMHIEPKLLAAFGSQVTNSLLTRATLCYVSTDGSEEQRYRAFVHSICSDQRVVRAWGAAGAAGQEGDWQELMGPESLSEHIVGGRQR